MYTQTSIIIQLLRVPKIHPVTPVIQLLDLEGLRNIPIPPKSSDRRSKEKNSAPCSRSSFRASVVWLPVPCVVFCRGFSGWPLVVLHCLWCLCTQLSTYVTMWWVGRRSFFLCQGTIMVLRASNKRFSQLGIMTRHDGKEIKQWGALKVQKMEMMEHLNKMPTVAPSSHWHQNLCVLSSLIDGTHWFAQICHFTEPKTLTGRKTREITNWFRICIRLYLYIPIRYPSSYASNASIFKLINNVTK